MKKDLQKKLARYSAAAGAVVVGTGASAQVMYTDVNPDYVHGGDEVQVGLDLNNDATFDFVIASADTIPAGGSQVEYTVIAPYGSVGNAIAGESPSGYDYALALNANDMIDASLNWIAATNTMTYRVAGAFPYGENWNGVTDKYLGLYFDIAGAKHYGWARLDAAGDTWTLKDYAYDATAGTGISAGDMGSVSVENLDMESLIHFINQANNTVQVKINGEFTNGVITVVSTSGAIVSTINVNSDIETIDMNGLASGMYIINASFAEGSLTKKMFVK